MITLIHLEIKNKSAILKRIALIEERITQLEQRLSMLEYDQSLDKLDEALGAFLPGKSEPSYISSPDDEASLFEILEIDTKVIKSDDNWTQIAWKLTIRNMSEKTLPCSAEINFLDEEGFIIQLDYESNLVLKPLCDNSSTGSIPMENELARSFHTIGAKVTLKAI